jgi:hypothetical protein
VFETREELVFAPYDKCNTRDEPWPRDFDNTRPRMAILANRCRVGSSFVLLSMFLDSQLADTNLGNDNPS